MAARGCWSGSWRPIWPEVYLVAGRHVANQIAVFGSQPGEVDYSPLWKETIVTFQRGVKPVLLTSDNLIKSLMAKGKLTVKANGIVLNYPIVEVGKR